MLVKSAKHKMVSKSSTEAELITLSDAVSIAANNVNSSKAQGYDVCAKLKQDNTWKMQFGQDKAYQCPVFLCKVLSR